MASIRRTMSPVPRPGTLPNGEACSVASPLSKSSSCTQNYPPPVGELSSSFGAFDYALYRTQALILGLFSKRYSRPLERPKPKGQFWRRSLVHFFICFMAGAFLGLTPFASMNLSANLMSKHQAFSFEIFSPPEKIQLFDVMPRNVTLLVESSDLNDNTTIGMRETKLDLKNETSDDTLTTPSVSKDVNTVFHKLLIIVTPTHDRPFQAYYLNRLAHTLRLIPPPLLWIVVDIGSQSAETADRLRRNGGILYRHLVCDKNLTDIKDRGAHQRNVALSHIETHRLDGIVYFADDDNIYSVDLFEQMRQIRRFGTWTVAKLMDSNRRAHMQGPICNGTQVIGWHSNEVTRRFRRFHAEMSGFAFNSTILWDPKRWHRPTLEPIRQLDTPNGGFQVSSFIEQVVEDESQMECLPQDHSRVMVWHLHVESSYSYPPEWVMKNNLDVIASLA
ncbi:Beta-1,4-xylosyltransferase IRX9H [Actinidia chinensis var. chinensis]|uniref:Glycosyltransferases n=1 Tax=Actinidia chinensis var. chinensis TaxID=1590841 RepID=A0A2R6Q2V9_ACTCC|nr:Beta-1,4-xylosyltransferase IRX9H [Actinidia chinensis var. chinensis]